jgi:hypothetical protein
MRPLDGMPVEGILQLIRHKLEREDLFVDVGVRHARVHAHLRVLRLASQPVVHDAARVHAAFAPVPAVLFHALLAAPHLRVLAQDVGQARPETLRVLQLPEDFVHQGVQIAAGGGRFSAARRHNHDRRVVATAAIVVVVVVVVVVAAVEAAASHGLSLPQPGLATVLKDLSKDDRNKELFAAKNTRNSRRRKVQ